MQNYGNKCFMQNFFSKFGKLAHFHLGSWRIFTWELGAFSLGNLAHFHLGTWHKTLICFILQTSATPLCNTRIAFAAEPTPFQCSRLIR